MILQSNMERRVRRYGVAIYNPPLLGRRGRKLISANETVGGWERKRGRGVGRFRAKHFGTVAMKNEQKFWSLKGRYFCGFDPKLRSLHFAKSRET